MGLIRLLLPRDGVVVLPLEGVHNAVQALGDRWRVWRSLRRCAELSGQASEGSRARVTGTVRVIGEPLVAPLSGRPCVAYRARAWPLGSPHAIDGALQEVARASSFAIEVDGETIVVDSAHVWLSGRRTRLGVDVKDRKTSFLMRQGVRTAHGYFGEVVVEDGARVTVGGVLGPSRKLVGTAEAPIAIRA